METSNSETLKQIASQKYDGKFEIFSNKSGSHGICVSKKTGVQSSPVMNQLSFFIFDNKANEIIFEDSLSNASVIWQNDNVVSVIRDVGIIKKNSESPSVQTVYSYNVIERKKSYK